MPNYDYRCIQCGHQEEILQKMSDAPITDCPKCNKATFKRQFGAGIGLQFHGSGFYSTDYGSHQTSSSEKKSPTTEKECGCGKSSCPA